MPKPLISATADEVQRLIAQAKEWATSLNKTVSLWISDKHDVFVTGIAAGFLACRIATATTIFSAIWPNLCWRLIVTPRFRCDTRCAGLRKIEQAVLKRQNAEALTSLAQDDPRATVSTASGACEVPAPEPDSAVHRGARPIARLYVEFSITTREALSNLPACSWPRL